jgi:hypothetical protein
MKDIVLYAPEYATKPDPTRAALNPVMACYRLQRDAYPDRDDLPLLPDGYVSPAADSAATSAVRCRPSGIATAD